MYLPPQSRYTTVNSSPRDPSCSHFMPTPTSMFPFSPQNLGTTHLFSVFKLSFQKCYISGIIQYTTFWDRLSFVQFTSLEVNQVVACVTVGSCSLLSSAPWYGGVAV